MILDYVKESLSLSLSLEGEGGRGNNPMFHTCGLKGKLVVYVELAKPHTHIKSLVTATCNNWRASLMQRNPNN